MKRCLSCAGTGQAFQEEPPCHQPCPDCDGTGWDCSEVAEEVCSLFQTHWVVGSRRRRDIARIIAHHMRGAE